MENLKRVSLPKDVTPIIEAWKRGDAIVSIARSYGVSSSAICKVLTRSGARTVQKTKGGRPRIVSAPVEVRQDMRLIEFSEIKINTVRRVTFAGEVVTMPRVSFIDGPAPVEA